MYSIIVSVLSLPYFVYFEWRNELSLGYGATAICAEGNAPLSLPVGLAGTRDIHGYKRRKWEMVVLVLVWQVGVDVLVFSRVGAVCWYGVSVFVFVCWCCGVLVWWTRCVGSVVCW